MASTSRRESGDRYDTQHHPARGSVGWHDATARIEGPAVADVAEHFRMRWHEVDRRAPAARLGPQPAGDVELQIVRTVPERIYNAVPRGTSGSSSPTCALCAAPSDSSTSRTSSSGRRKSPLLLSEKLSIRPLPTSGSSSYCPPKPNSGADDTPRRPRRADRSRRRATGESSPARSTPASGTRADPIYVHAKIAIVDDRWLTLGSANLNEHSLFNDTEMNIVTHDPSLARQTRLRLWSEHLELPVDEIPEDPIGAIDELWKPISSEQLERRSTGLAAHPPPRPSAAPLEANTEDSRADRRSASSTADLQRTPS